MRISRKYINKLGGRIYDDRTNFLLDEWWNKLHNSQKIEAYLKMRHYTEDQSKEYEEVIEHNEEIQGWKKRGS